MSPDSVMLPRGRFAFTGVTVSSSSGFSSATTLSIPGLPPGIFAFFLPNPVTPPANGSASSTLLLFAFAATPGTLTVPVTGTAGALTHSATLTLKVQ